ncbi:MAG TPA: hypothetical protein VK919_09285 [Solirubrobacterales bacterium]|nr:hypothetical protein [Solirubrobacterales bacterium]
MTRARTFLAICALALPVSLIGAGCGGDDAESADPADVVERTFDNDTRVTSGVFDLELSVAATGEEGGELTAALSGPFQGEDTDDPQLPQLDLSGSVSGEGGGESVNESGRIVVTDDNAFVEYRGDVYEAGPELYGQLRDEFESQSTAGSDASFREQCEQALSQLDTGGDTSICETDFTEDWLTNLENEGTEDVDGLETVHVSGALDVERMLNDVIEFARTIPGVSIPAVDPAQLANAVPEATFDLYSGTEDDELRRLDATLVIDPSAFTAGVAVLPVERVEIDFAVRVSAVNEPQTIEPPAGPTRPLEELLGDDFDLEGLGGAGLGSGGLGDLPELDDSSRPGGGGGGGGDDRGAEDIDPEDAQRYLDCIQDAAGDPEAINACADEL